MKKISCAFAFLMACGGSTEAAPESDPAQSTGGVNVEATEAIPNARQVDDGILSGGQPSAEQLEQLAADGYRTVISLRTDGEAGSEGEQQQVEALGMGFVSIPVDGADGVNVDNARALDEALASPDAQPAVVHCGTGNRAGALLALRAWLGGSSIDEAMQQGLEAGLTRLEEHVRGELARLCEEDPDRSC